MIEMSQLARTAILKIIEEEGGWVYTDHPVDKDKGTYAGVRYVTFRDYSIRKNNTALAVAEFKTAAEYNLIKDTVIDIYLEEYYNKLQIDRLLDTLKMPVFSCGVNCGTRRAGIILQRTVNDTLSSFDDRPLIEDGIIGDKTLAALDAIIYKEFYFAHNYASELTPDSKLATLINTERVRNNFVKRWIRRYVNITIDVPEYTVFLNGWFNRAEKYWVS